MNRPVLVTGASGFAGGHLVDLLEREGASIVACHRSGTGAPPAGPGITWQSLDLLDESSVESVVRHAHPAVIYHCAGAAHVGSAWEDSLPSLQVNALGTHYLLRAVRRHAADARVLVPSSGLVYRRGDAPADEDTPLAPGTPYGVSKLAQEMTAMRAARVDGIHVLVARPFNHVGPRQDASFSTSGFARQIAEIEAGGRPPVIEVGNLDARRDLTDVRDTVRAYVLMVERALPGRPMNVCSGKAYRIGDLLEALLRLARVRVEIKVDPTRLRPADLPLVAGSRARIERELGWRPEIGIERSLEDILNGWRTAIARPRPDEEIERSAASGANARGTERRE
jgi:GDP-4-dehydro-6-deoxy-D-mannose reductase